MAVFPKFRGLDVKYSHRDTQKTRRFLMYLHNNLFRGVGCSLIEELPQKTKKN